MYLASEQRACAFSLNYESSFILHLFVSGTPNGNIEHSLRFLLFIVRNLYAASIMSSRCTD